MNVCEMIDVLESYGSPEKMVATIGQNSDKWMFVTIFGNANGIPALRLSDEMPPQGAKTCSTLLYELKLWRDESVFYDYSTDMHLVVLFIYEDESYDFRHYKLQAVKETGEYLLLIGDINENMVMREHYDAFDESMFDDGGDQQA